MAYYSFKLPESSSLLVTNLMHYIYTKEFYRYLYFEVIMKLFISRILKSIFELVFSLGKGCLHFVNLLIAVNLFQQSNACYKTFKGLGRCIFD